MLCCLKCLKTAEICGKTFYSSDRARFKVFVMVDDLHIFEEVSYNTIIRVEFILPWTSSAPDRVLTMYPDIWKFQNRRISLLITRWVISDVDKYFLMRTTKPFLRWSHVFCWSTPTGQYVTGQLINNKTLPRGQSVFCCAGIYNSIWQPRLGACTMSKPSALLCCVN